MIEKRVIIKGLTRVIYPTPVNEIFSLYTEGGKDKRLFIKVPIGKRMEFEYLVAERK